MRKKVLVIQNAPNEGLGTIVRALRRFGLEADYIRPSSAARWGYTRRIDTPS
jgi:hypothetical protein